MSNSSLTMKSIKPQPWDQPSIKQYTKLIHFQNWHLNEDHAARDLALGSLLSQPKKTQLFPSSCCIKSSAPQRRRTTLQLPSCLNLAWKGRGNFAKKSGHFYPSQVHPASSDLFFRSSGSAARAFGFFAPAHGLPRASLESSKAWKKPWEECFWTNKFVEWFAKKVSISCSQVSARACANADCPHSTKNLSQCQVVSYVHSRYQQIIYTYSKMSVLVSQTLIFLLHYGTNRLTAAPVVVDDWLFAAACRKCSTVASAAVGCCWDTKSGNLAKQPTNPQAIQVGKRWRRPTPKQQPSKPPNKLRHLGSKIAVKDRIRLWAWAWWRLFLQVEFPMSCKAIGCGETTRTKCKSWQDTMCLIKLSFKNPLS